MFPCLQRMPFIAFFIHWGFQRLFTLKPEWNSEFNYYNCHKRSQYISSSSLGGCSSHAQGSLRNVEFIKKTAGWHSLDVYAATRQWGSAASPNVSCVASICGLSVDCMASGWAGVLTLLFLDWRWLNPRSVWRIFVSRQLAEWLARWLSVALPLGCSRLLCKENVDTSGAKRPSVDCWDDWVSLGMQLVPTLIKTCPAAPHSSSQIENWRANSVRYNSQTEGEGIDSSDCWWLVRHLFSHLEPGHGLLSNGFVLDYPQSWGKINELYLGAVNIFFVSSVQLN